MTAAPALVRFTRLIQDDDQQPRPDTRDDGFWPSRDPESSGYVLPENFEAEYSRAVERMVAFDRGDWYWIGVRARAEIRVPYGQDFITTTIDSPGLWGVDSDCGEAYLDEVFQDEVATLRDMLDSLRTWKEEA